jgi:Na+-driven multidrug efflux pump
MTVLNVILNVVLIAGFGPVPAFGTLGAAMGTVIAGAVITVVALWSFFRDRWVVAFHRGMHWGPDWEIIRELFRFGLPTGIQGVAMNVAGVALYSFIGSLERSAEAQAVYAVSYNQLFSFITWTSVGLMGATAAVAGQNLGARKPERTVKAVRVAARIGLGVAALVGVFFLTIPRDLLGLFGMEQATVLDLGAQLLRYLSLSGLLVTVALAYTGGLQGTGDTKSPLYISVVSQIVVPLGLCATLTILRGLHPSDIWLAIVLGHATRATLSFLVFRREGWRDIEVHIGGERP